MKYTLAKLCLFYNNLLKVMKLLLKDKDVRKLLLRNLNDLYENDSNTRIINELGIDFGASRVDVAVVNGIMHGYEIKSDLDNLDRLPRQMEYYNKMFERMTIVTSKKHLNEILALVPKWWGIQVVSSCNNKLIVKRKGRYKKQNDKELLLKLLWKKDLEGFVDVLQLPKKFKNKKKNQLLKKFLEEADIEIVRKHVYYSLKSRKNWREDL